MNKIAFLHEASEINPDKRSKDVNSLYTLIMSSEEFLMNFLRKTSLELDPVK